MKKIYIILFFTSFLFIGYTQNTFSGKIIDEQGQIIFGADIYSENLEIGTTSDENGDFIIKNIPNGKHLFIISFMGFEMKQKNLTYFN